MNILQTYHHWKRKVQPEKLPRFAGELQNLFPEIRQGYVDFLSENKSVLRPIDDVSPDQVALNQDKKWKALFLLAYGNENHRALNHFPSLKALAKKYPEIKLMLFSKLESGKHIPPHKGRNIAVYRLQLGIDIQHPASTELRVENVRIQLKEGELFVFDDTFEHEAKNDGPTDRTVLIIDYEKSWPFPISILQKKYLRRIAHSSYIQDAVKRW